MKDKDELELILKLIGKHNLPLNPILGNAIKEIIDDCSEKTETVHCDKMDGCNSSHDLKDKADDLHLSLPENNDIAEKSENVPHIMEIMDRVPVGTIIIGEIYYPGKRSKDVTPIMGSLPDKALGSIPGHMLFKREIIKLLCGGIIPKECPEGIPVCIFSGCDDRIRKDNSVRSV